MVRIKAAASCLALMVLPACASITQGTTQSVAVDTTPSRSAVCQLSNENGTWTIARTPGSTIINKGSGPLNAVCRTEDGWNGSNSTVSYTGGAVWGNVLFGGILGAAIDMSSGAAYNYPGEILVPLSPPPPPTSLMSSRQ